MKKLMILGASILQLPAIRQAKKMGLCTIVVDIDEEAIGFKEADVCVIKSTLDIPGVVEAAKKYQIDGIMTLASDMPIRTIAKVVKELHLAGVSEETALSATNKAVMRTVLKSHEIPIPKFKRVSTKKEFCNALFSFEDKIIVKPADNSGSRGIFLLNDLKKNDEIEYAFNHSKKHSRSGEVILEDYMEGPEVSVEAISIEGEVHLITITDKLTTGAPRFVEMGHSEPSRLDSNTQEAILEITKKAIKAIGVENGPSHTEIKVTKDGPKIVELGARLGGDNITTSLVPLSTGIDMVDWCIRIALGEKPVIRRKFDKGSAIKYFSSPPGILKNVEGIENAKKIKGVQQISFTKKVNTTINTINSSVDRVGFVISQGDTVQEALEICEKAEGLVRFEIQ